MKFKNNIINISTSLEKISIKEIKNIIKTPGTGIKKQAAASNKPDLSIQLKK
jgi:hypothetical protein